MPNASLKTYHNANLVATYEEIFLPPNDHRIAKYDGDHYLHYFPFDVTDEQIRPVLDKALEAIGMTEEEYAAVEEFGRDRTGIFTRIRERLFDTPDSPNSRFDPDLVSDYENFMNIPRDQTITVGFMDVEGSRFRYGVTDEQIRPIYDKALEALGMSEAEFNNNRSLFRFTDEHGHVQTYYKARMHQIRDPEYHGGADVMYEAALQRNAAEKAEIHRAFYEPFIDKLAKGETTADEIDNYVEYWHNNNIGDSLQKFLGMTDFEYEQWGKSNDSLVLEQIAYCRKYDMDYAEYLTQKGNERAERQENTLKTNLIATYEDLQKIEPKQRITEWYGDYGIHVFKYGITDEQIQPVYERSLEAIGMTEEEFNANADLFPYRQDMIDRMELQLYNQDPFIDKLAKGETTAFGIDDYIKYWNTHNTGDSLQKFLGMTDFEYSKWEQATDDGSYENEKRFVLEQIAYCRKYDMDYAEYLSQRENELAEIRKKFHKIDLIATYEDVVKLDPQQSIIRWIGDYHIHVFKDGITDEQIDPVFKRALYAIGMTEDEFFANIDQFRYRQAMFDRMSEHLSNIPDPTITPEELKEYGYTWEWVHPLRQEAAERLFNKNVMVLQLFDDDTEKGVETLEELREHAKNSGIFGIEKEHWDYLRETNALTDFHEIQAEITEKEPSREDLLVNGKEDAFGIYQLAPVDANAEIMFESFGSLLATGKQIDRKNYQLVYTAPLDPKMTLDGIYQKFNLDLPHDYRGRSLSVSDIIVFQQSGEISAHYVDSFGFKEVPNFLALAQDDVEYSMLPDQPKKTPQDKLKEITDKLEDGIAELCDSEQYKSYLKTMSKFHKYSVNNSMLIWMQKPEATMVAGYNAWKSKFGRQVMKGEHGIMIIAPCPSQKTEELPKLDPKTMQPMYDEDGQPIMQNVKSTSMRFRATTVFDVSQTEGNPLPEAPIEDLSGDVTNYTTMLQALIQAAPCPVSFGDPGDGAKGSFSRATQSITIKEGMSQQETLATLVHEIGHSILHSDREEALKLPRGTREVQAESVAYTVCSHYGIDTSAWTFGYVATWSRGQEMSTLKSTLDTIRSTAAQIIDNTNDQLAQILAPKQTQQISQEPSLTM